MSVRMSTGFSIAWKLGSFFSNRYVIWLQPAVTVTVITSTGTMTAFRSGAEGLFILVARETTTDSTQKRHV